MNPEFNTHITLKDAGFYLTPTSFYHLIISLSHTGLQLAVFDPAKEKFIGFANHIIHGNTGKQAWYDELSKILAEDELLKFTYKSTRILWQSQCSTLVPIPLYDENEAKTYLQFNQVLNADDVVISDKLRTADAFNIFALPVDLMNAVNFLHPQIHHHSSVFIESLLLLNRQNIHPTQVFVQVHPGFFDLVVIHERKLHFYNTFAYSSSEDFIYFLLFTFEQLHLLPEQTPVTLSGEIQKNSAIYEIMFKYIRNLNFAAASSQVSDSYILQDMDAWLYQNLFNTILCEL